MENNTNIIITIKIINKMKKTYISPSMETIKVNVTNIIAASMAVYSDIEVDTSVDNVQLGREDNTLSGSNVWEQGW